MWFAGLWNLAPSMRGIRRELHSLIFHLYFFRSIFLSPRFMKYIFFFLIWIFTFSSQLFASSFTNLDEICRYAADGVNVYPTYTSPSGIKTQQDIILPHILKKITTARNVVKYDNTLYMSADTFTDDYNYLGSYLVKYNCSKPGWKLLRMSWLTRWENGSTLRSFIEWVNEYGIIFSHWHASSPTSLTRIYDFKTRKTFILQYKNTSWYNQTRGTFAQVKPESFDGKCIVLQVNERQSWNDGTITANYDDIYCIR